jgi:hypothetical protein
VRFSYLNVHEAKLNTESDKMEFSVAAMIPKGNVEDVKAVRDAIEAQKKAIWFDEKKKLPPQFWYPLKDGDEDTKQNGDPLPEEYKGHWILNCKTGEDSQPNVVGTTRDEKGKFVPLAKNEIKSGDWGRIGINIKGYVKGTGGVGAYLTSVQLTAKGDPLSSHSSAEDDFGDFDDDGDGEVDPLG